MNAFTTIAGALTGFMAPALIEIARSRFALPSTTGPTLSIAPFVPPTQSTVQAPVTAVTVTPGANTTNVILAPENDSIPVSTDGTPVTPPVANTAPAKATTVTQNVSVHHVYPGDTYDMSARGLFFDVLRVSVRPVLTYGFFTIFTIVTLSILRNGLYEQHLPIREVMDVAWPESTQTLWATITAFWFGSRTVKWRK